MSMSHKPAIKAPTLAKGERASASVDPEKSSVARQQFLAAAATMSWQLAVAVLIPVLAGVKLDDVFGTHNVFTFIGLGLAVAGSVVVMWRAMRAANRLPVPKLTPAEKQAIKKAYEDEDKEND